MLFTLLRPQLCCTQCLMNFVFEMGDIWQDMRQLPVSWLQSSSSLCLFDPIPHFPDLCNTIKSFPESKSKSAITTFYLPLTLNLLQSNYFLYYTFQLILCNFVSLFFCGYWGLNAGTLCLLLRRIYYLNLDPRLCNFLISE
jgi:hypothetical protein